MFGCLLAAVRLYSALRDLFREPGARLPHIAVLYRWREGKD